MRDIIRLRVPLFIIRVLAGILFPHFSSFERILYQSRPQEYLENIILVYIKMYISSCGLLWDTFQNYISCLSILVLALQSSVIFSFLCGGSGYVGR